MLQSLVSAIQEVLAEVGKEIVADPMRMVAELVQFAVLLGIVWVVAIGFGKRRGFVLNMLTERAASVKARLADASHADDDLKHAQQIAALKVRTANAEARRILADAKREATEAEVVAQADSDAEAKRILDRAEAALATEDAEMHLEVREQLVELVAQATRSIMNEKMSVAEQRKLIEGSIVAGLGKAQAKRPPRTSAKRTSAAISTGAHR